MWLPSRTTIRLKCQVVQPKVIHTNTTFKSRLRLYDTFHMLAPKHTTRRWVYYSKVKNTDTVVKTTVSKWAKIIELTIKCLCYRCLLSQSPCPYRSQVCVASHQWHALLFPHRLSQANCRKLFLLKIWSKWLNDTYPNVLLRTSLYSPHTYPPSLIHSRLLTSIARPVIILFLVHSCNRWYFFSIETTPLATNLSIRLSSSVGRRVLCVLHFIVSAEHWLFLHSSIWCMPSQT